MSVETVGMTMRFGSFTALNDVSIRVAAGSFHVLLGENGAGKSTLVKCMMGFYKPTSGQMMVEGLEVEIPIRVPPMTSGSAWSTSISRSFPR